MHSLHVDDCGDCAAFRRKINSFFRVGNFVRQGAAHFQEANLCGACASHRVGSKSFPRIEKQKSALNTCQSVRRPLTHLLNLLQIQFHLLDQPFGKLLPLGLDAFAVWQQ